MVRAWLIVCSLFVSVALGSVTGTADGNQPERHWAFEPIRHREVPPVRDAKWVRTPIDAIVLNRLEREGLRPAPPADRRILLRRLYLDLTGLPPSPADQEAFLNDASPDAVASVVDDLLSRPQYGERWGRHWLDVVRYAESNGYEHDGLKPNAWRYRDYVIDAFNRDKPYDRFLIEQLAGDEIDGANAETQIATTFLRLGTWDAEPADPLIDRYDQLDDVLGTTATTFLGLTLRCARCHDHKFEPFSQEDYYRMLAVFDPLKRPFNGRSDLDREIVTESSVALFYIDALKKTIRERVFREKKTTLPVEAVEAFQTAEQYRTEDQQKLISKFGDDLEKEIDGAMKPEEKARYDGWRKQLAATKARQTEKPLRAYMWYEDGPIAPATHLLQRGNPNRPKKEVSPGLPAVLVDRQPDSPKPRTMTSGRRLWLADWMVRPDNPLVARVMVNRVWQWHFGRGLVASSNDFGTAGEAPSDPALLDWLASEFIRNGWRLKPLHRLIVLSNTYQMSSAATGDAPRADPKNTLLTHWGQRRLEAEAVRDSILAVTGQLNPQMAGKSIYPPISRAVLEGQSKPGSGWPVSNPAQAARRSVYIFAKRGLPLPELEVLDSPDTTTSCEQRPVSTNGPQALTFLNGDFINQQAQLFSARLVQEAGADARAQVERAFALALCRPPRPIEVQSALDFLGKQRAEINADRRRSGQETEDAGQKALEAFCLVLLNTNEFVYLD